MLDLTYFPPNFLFTGQFYFINVKVLHLALFYVLYSVSLKVQVLDQWNTTSDVRLFANDALMYRHIRSEEDAFALQKDLSSLEKWEREWQMEFHPQKCTVIHVTNKRTIIDTQYTLHGHKLEVVTNNKYLGVTTWDGMIT